MTSLKIKYANEMIESMAKSLGDEEFTKLFKSASLEKIAGQALDAFKKDADMAVQAGTDLELVYTKHLGALQQEENTTPGTIEQARRYMASKAATPGHRQPGQVMPEADDCCMDTGKEMVAAEFAVEHLVKIADALDKQGFETLANYIDVTIEHITSKISKK